jgi:HK97 family phage portal protein
VLIADYFQSLFGVNNRKLFGRNNQALPSPNGTQVGGRIGYPSKAGYLANVEHGFNRNPVVAACVGVYASTLNEPPLAAMYDDGTINRNHPVSLLFRKPNPRMGQAEFWQIVWTYLAIGGNAYIVKVRSAMGNIVELYPYSDAHVAPLLNDLGWVYAYRYQSGNITQDWPADDVIHIQNPAYRDPVNMHKGVSPISVAWDKINTYNELQATIYSLVASNAIPSGILSAPGDVPISQVESLRAQLRKRKDANGKDRTDAIVLGNGMSYQQMGLDAQKLQAIETTQELETAICGAFRIHPAVVLTSAGLARSTYNNLASAYQEYTTLTRVPFWNALEEQLESGLRKEFPDVQLAFDTSEVQALQPDAATVEAQALQQFTANIITLNEARATLKYEDVENGDVFAYEQQPHGGFGAFTAPEPEAKQSVETNADPIESIEGRKVKWHEPEAVKYWQKQEDVILKAAEATQADVAEVMKRVERAVMKQVKADRFVGVNKMVKAPQDAINIADLVRQFIAANEATQEALRTQIIEMTLESVGGDLTQVQSLTDQIRDEQIRKSTENMKESLNTAKKDVAKVLEANAGKPVAEVQKSLLEKFSEMQTSRAKMIAVTTCKAQATVVQRQTVKRVNQRETDPKRKVVQVWLSQRDSDVRKTHKDLDGEWIEEGETFDQFVSGAGEGPGLGEPQEAINCRCTLRPVRRSRVQERN